jgi:hypothetical protein
MADTVSCSRCKVKHWTCLGCSKQIVFANYSPKDTAMYCNCCDHKFVCKECYTKTPGYDVWKPIFGSQHSVKDNISGESSANRFFKAQLEGKDMGGTRIGNLTIFSTNKF